MIGIETLGPNCFYYKIGIYTIVTNIILQRGHFSAVHSCHISFVLIYAAVIHYKFTLSF